MTTGADRDAQGGDDSHLLDHLIELRTRLLRAVAGFAIALAALAIHNGAPYPAFDAENESPLEGAPEAVLATSIGYHRYEGAALVVKA